jgi:hypothetical protein
LVPGGTLDWWVKERREWWVAYVAETVGSDGLELLIFVPRATQRYDWLATCALLAKDAEFWCGLRSDQQVSVAGHEPMCQIDRRTAQSRELVDAVVNP